MERDSRLWMMYCLRLENVRYLESSALDNEELYTNVWKISGVLMRAVEAVSEQEPLDIVVPINKIDSFINTVNKLEKIHNIKMISFGHVGDGYVHLCIVRGERDEKIWEDDLGAKNFRDALADKYKRFSEIKVNSKEEIVVTCGSTEAMMATTMSITDPGDKVIIFSPFYEDYEADIILFGAVPIYVPIVPAEVYEHIICAI